jgi:putative transposase
MTIARENALPCRRVRLPHQRPPWVAEAAPFLLTVCCRPRHVNQLCLPVVARTIRQALEFHDQRATWSLHACVLMPDHLHLLVTIPAATSQQRVIANWKRYVARHHGVSWQQDFFEHRLRQDEHFDAKVDYLRQNPVRARLVERADAWPYFWTW